MCTCSHSNRDRILACVLRLVESFSLLADDWQRCPPPTSGPGRFSVWLEGKGAKGESFTCKTACSFQFQGEMRTNQCVVKHIWMNNRKMHWNEIQDSYGKYDHMIMLKHINAQTNQKRCSLNMLCISLCWCYPFKDLMCSRMCCAHAQCVCNACYC